MLNPFRSHALQHTRLLCPPLSPRVCSKSCPLSQWCYLTISSFAAPFSFPPQSFPDTGSFPVSRFFTSGSQNIGASASASVLPMNIQDWFPLELTGLITLLSQGHSRVFSNTTVRKHHVFSVQPSLWLINCSSEYYCFWWVLWGLIVNYQAESSLVDPWICNLC